MKSKTVDRIMLGDWLMVNSHPTKVTEENIGHIANSSREGIPLTAAVCKKIGFKREGGVSYLHQGKFSLALFHWNEHRTELVISGDKVTHILDIDISAVHEFQHALDVCGITIEITL